MEKPKSRFPNFAFLFVLNKFFLFIFIAVAFIVNGFFISPAFALTLVETDIIEDTIWGIDESPYLIYDSILVSKGATLTIEPGVVVKFEKDTNLIVSGSLKAEGTVAGPIYFTSTKDDTLGGDTNFDEEGTAPSKGDWNGIVIMYDGEELVVDSSTTEGSILNNVFSKYSSQGLLIFDKNISSERLYIDNQILLFNSKSTFSKLSTFNVELFKGSTASIDDSILNSMDGSAAVYLFDASKLDITNSSIHGCFSCRSTVLVFEGSTLSLDNVQIEMENKEINTYGVIISDRGTILTMKKNTLTGAYGQVFIDTDTKVVIENSIFKCIYSCISGFSGSLSLTNSKISGASAFGIFTNDYPRVIHKDSEDPLCSEDYDYDDEYLVELCNGEDIIINSLFEINNNEIFGNGTGIASYGGKIIGKNNSIYNNKVGAFNVNSYDEESVCDNDEECAENTEIDDSVDLRNNFWGDKTGPKNLLTNPAGLGNTISDNVLYSPFLKIDPLIEKTGLSNILFIPGFQGSRIYRMVGSEEAGTEYEQKLWEPEINGDISDMLMNENGESIDKNVYTRDLISEASVFGVKTIDIYKSFVAKLDEMVSKDEIADWKAIPYDWRLSPLDIVNRGVEKENGNISYTEELTEDQLPYIIDQLQKLCDSSATGDVSIVTHSNGGLVAESLIAKLIEMKNSGESDLVDHIDNLIMVAPPLLGTPASTVGLLHGYDQGMAQNILLGRKKAREFGQNVPGAYGLIPSKKYMSEVGNNLISLDSSLDKVNNWRTKYGDSIDTFDKFQSFLLDIEKSRLQPSYDDLVNPTILNETILNKANLLHNTIDNLEIPSSIKVSQVAGFGLPTVSSFQYKSKSECLLFGKFLCLKKKIVLSSDVGFTSGGDGTVVSASALLGEGEEYYLNLNAYNRKNKEGKLLYFNTNHSDIFEVPSLLDLINNIMRSDINLPEYITINKPSPVDYTVLKMRSPVAMDIYNEDGLHTGVEENEAPDLITIEDEIPNSYYMEIGEEKYIIVPSDDNYRLELTGLDDGIFTLEQQQFVDDLPRESVVFRDIPTTLLLRGEVDITNNNLATSISIDENNDGIFESNIKPTDLFLPEDLGNDIIKKSSSGSSVLESVLTFADQSTISINNFIEDSRIIVTESFIKKINQNNFNKATTMNITTPKVNEELIYPERNILSASVGSAYEINPDRLKLQLIFVGLFVLLLLGLKFIFKLI